MDEKQAIEMLEEFEKLSKKFRNKVYKKYMSTIVKIERYMSLMYDEHYHKGQMIKDPVNTWLSKTEKHRIKDELLEMQESYDSEIAKEMIKGLQKLPLRNKLDLYIVLCMIELVHFYHSAHNEIELFFIASNELAEEDDNMTMTIQGVPLAIVIIEQFIRAKDRYAKKMYQIVNGRINKKRLINTVNKTVRVSVNDINTTFATQEEYANSKRALKRLKKASDRYRLEVTYDSRTSDICRAIDTRRTHYVHDARIGYNFPPFHPHCRTIAISVYTNDTIV